MSIHVSKEAQKADLIPLVWVEGLIEWWSSQREVRSPLLHSGVGSIQAWHPVFWEPQEQSPEAPLYRTRLSVVPARTCAHLCLVMSYPGPAAWLLLRLVWGSPFTAQHWRRVSECLAALNLGFHSIFSAACLPHPCL